ncbi:MAG: hypothetical protein ACE5KV_07390, partial [Thermoplasmata archaeon]
MFRMNPVGHNPFKPWYILVESTMHTEVWKGTLQDGLDKWEADKFVQEVQAGYTKAFKRKPSR